MTARLLDLVDDGHLAALENAPLPWWWMCEVCGAFTQGGVWGLQAHASIVHHNRARGTRLGLPKKEQRWTPNPISSSTGSKRHLRVAWSSTTGDSP